MRPASIGPVKALLRRVDLSEARAVIDRAMRRGRKRAPGADGVAVNG
jgi:phosphotransferase system, enzyme I, PtsP